MKILYIARLAVGASSVNRIWALRRLGHEVTTLDYDPYTLASPFLMKVAFRLADGPHAVRLNRDILAQVERERPDVVWADKILLMKPATLKRIRELGILSVSYMIDNAYGPRKDPGWRMYNKCVPYYDLHVTQRDVSLTHYRERGARDVMKVQTAYEPTIHFPPLTPFTDAERTREVSFIGSPYDNRGEIVIELAAAGIPITISGNPRAWSRVLSPVVYEQIFRTGELWEQDYRETIWKSKINLSFLTKSNQDEYTHKSFEIAGCGGFLLAERCPGHELKFKEGEEAAFFSDTPDLIAQIRRYLPDEPARNRIAAAGCARALSDGYHNDRQMALVVERLAQIRAQQPSRSGL